MFDHGFISPVQEHRIFLPIVCGLGVCVGMCVCGGESESATELFEGCESDTFRRAVSDQNTVAYE